MGREFLIANQDAYEHSLSLPLSTDESSPLLDRLGDTLKVVGTELNHAVIQSLEVSADKSGITQTLTTREVMP